MKCDDCVNLLEAYVDGEVGEHESERVFSSNLIIPVSYDEQ